jgi:hypothetical protein
VAADDFLPTAEYDYVDDAVTYLNIEAALLLSMN